jgi:hypothetical protein
VDAPSSKAVEEAGHFEKIVLREKAVGKRTFRFNLKLAEIMV